MLAPENTGVGLGVESAYLSIAHPWHCAQQTKHAMHPAVLAALALCNGAGTEGVAFQWPHKSESDPLRLAYTQDTRKGIAGRTTVTSVGKYLTKVFPGLTDHAVRELAYRFNADGCAIHRTMDKILEAIQKGPVSCMQWSEDRLSSKGGHPYQAYAPELGWGIATRTVDGRIDGRALVNDKAMGFVRSYGRSDGGYSQTDEELEAYLTGLGYADMCQWPEGTRIARVDNRYDEPMFPYIDGNNQRVTKSSDGSYRICDEGQYECDRTDGRHSSVNTRECDDCNDSFPEDDGDGAYVGRHQDRWVCHCCLDSYSHVTGRGGDEYYIHDDNAVRVGNNSYDSAYLSENDIVELDNGDYAHMDAAFCCPVGDTWHLNEEGTDTKDEGYCLDENTWTCYGSNDVYSTNTAPVTVDGEEYHPDHAPEEEDDDAEESPTESRPTIPACCLDNSKTDHTNQLILAA